MALDIMMPFYGRFDYLREAVLSVLAQSDPDWRLVVIDDVNPDVEPGRWVKRLNDDRVMYIRNDKNLRPSRNYNKAIGLASTEFVTIMGCDDLMGVEYVARVKHLAREHPGVSIIQPGVHVIDGAGSPSMPLADRVKALYRPRGKGIRVLSGETLAVSLLRGNWTYFPSLAWRTELLRSSNFRVDLDVVQDLAQLFKLTVSGASLLVDDHPVFSYRRHPRSVSAVTGPDGTKFTQESTFFAEAESTSARLGWMHAARAARTHLSSRLNALNEFPGALRHGNRLGRQRLLRHILRRSEIAARS